MSDSSSTKNVISGFAYYLSENRLIDQQVALNALKEANDAHTSYIDYLVKQHLLEETRVANAAAEYFGLPLCDINALNHDLIPAEYLNIQLVKKKAALPLFKKSGLLYLAIVDPTIENLYEIRFLTGLDIRLLLVESSKLTQVIDELLNTLILSEMNELGNETASSITVNAYKEENDEGADVVAYDVESAPVVNYVKPPIFTLNIMKILIASAFASTVFFIQLLHHLSNSLIICWRV
jgi:type IV pilus assembly protein PilB